MEIGLLAIIGLIIGLVAGGFVGKMTLEKVNARKIAASEQQAQQLLKNAEQEGERKRSDLIKTGRSQANRLKNDAEKEAQRNRKKIEEVNRKTRKKENEINQKLNSLRKKETELDDFKRQVNKQLELVKNKEKEINKKQSQFQQKEQELKKKESKIEHELRTKLEKVASLTADEAKQQLMDAMVEKAETDAMAYIKDIVAESKLTANKEAKKIIIQTIQRTAAEHTIENTVSVFNLESDDVKGQIIGREGRNIRALEAATGVEIIVDDTPEAIIISGYDPVRREIARLSLQRLVSDGRIHPARIEEIVNKTKKQINQQIVEIGERVVIDLNIHGIHPELIKTVGRMRFRSSYGQNLLQHSIETANICAIMAAELGLKPHSIKLAKRAGLLHDIGKVPHEETDLSHALLGLKWTEKYGEHKAVCNAVGAHHDEIEMTHMISPIVAAADAISGARPGARREILESYLKRIAELETLARSYEGVDKAYAIQAGRELRVIVRSDEVDDNKAEDLSLRISTKIQTEMQYPGQIKVTVIREKRAISFAR